MAFLDPYATRTELKSYLQIGSSVTDHDGGLDDALNSATEEINNHTSRQFNRDDVIISTGVQTRVYPVRYSWLVEIDDVHTDEDLVIKTDDSGDGTFETTWSITDYQLEPLNGIRDGNTGWPFFKIRAIAGKAFPTLGHIASLQVTGHFGWAAVPANVHQACLLLAAETFKLREAPFGVAGWSEFGAIRVRDIPKVEKLLFPYQRMRVKIRA